MNVSSEAPQSKAVSTPKSRWPKILPPLTSEQMAIRDDFMRLHLEAMQTKWYGIIEKFNHGYPLRSFSPGCRTLEIGAGIGSHLNFEKYTEQDYYALELRPELCEAIKKKYPSVKAIAANCQERLPFEDGYFSRVLAIHVLEHLPDLPAALREIWRVLKNDGLFSVVIPAEGGLANAIARNLSGKREFTKKYHQSYDWLIKSEHINMPNEIINELNLLYNIQHRKFYPLFIPSINLNLAIGLTFTKKLT
ncbi:MAG: class I SAM-dependent methyltransferase [Deltaproteobacteria bacterium]|jgi:SAM-dependent methyltransferase|nr:class I SAM-dependent methyltransferase [Deltaproteobacteria bacterium]